MGEFHGADGFVPGFGVWRAVDSNVGFNFLIEAFCCSITLWSVSCHKIQFDSQEFKEFLEWFGSKSWVSVRDDTVGESKLFVDIVE